MKSTNLKRILGLFFTLAVVGVLVTSCEKELITDESLENEIQNETLAKFYNNDVDDVIEEFNVKILTQEEALFTDVEIADQGIDERGPCCDVGNIVNLSGGTNRFRVPFKYDNNSGFILTVWQGSSFQSSGYISIPLSGCVNSNHLTDLDNFANIQTGQSYTLRVFLYSGSGSFCDMGSKSFIGE